jgi:hypothetical protein
MMTLSDVPRNVFERSQIAFLIAAKKQRRAAVRTKCVQQADSAGGSVEGDEILA